ncbi:ABC transporter permease [Orrella daihaiensis]|uniref:ABC transporter permease n=1 Tax=Orrella daihaiensis TaxID=2782176 RepID=A0ABY4AKZ0_9BURK|nr:FtsX-like permease family protein [Orrella daihaiensis]UOD50956.1 ABC transporter permease [Orrella daihaiensis]
MIFLLDLAWRDLKSSGRSLWIFVASLVLGVSLVAAGGGLYQQITDALRADVKLLFGGDVEIQAQQPLPDDILNWVRARGDVSQVVELRTMLMTDQGRSQLVELFSVDDAYPLYGKLTLEPIGEPQNLLGLDDGQWGVAVDGTLARRLGLSVGDNVSVGVLSMQVRAIVVRQPDRSLRADWGAAPVLITEDALMATGLIQPFSRVEYLYRVRLPGVDAVASQFRDELVRAFPTMQAEVRSFDERSDRMTEILGQIGSGLLLVGFSALFIGGLGVFNSIKAHLDGKLASLATLRALGLRDWRVAWFVLLQVLILAALSSALGVIIGVTLALFGAAVVADQLPVNVLIASLWQPALVAWLFGVLTAFTFAMPAVGRALSVSPAVLFRGLQGQVLHASGRVKQLTALVAIVTVGLLMLTLPDARFGFAFVVAVTVLLVMLGAITLIIRALATRMQRSVSLPLSLQMALASLQQSQSPMRVALVSLGSALTLLVACTLVVMTLLRTVNETVPDQAPAMVFYDIQTDQVELLNQTLQEASGLAQVRTAPFVLGRLVGVNGSALTESQDIERLRESRDEHKLSDSRGNFDDVVVKRGAWWPDDYNGPPIVAMEDREADQLGLSVGDKLTFEILGQTFDAALVAIYTQRRVQARLWLEAIFSDGALDPFVTRYVGAAWLPADQAVAMQDRLATVAPNIATARTELILRESRVLLGRASMGLAVIALVCLAASLLVLASVVAASRTRQIYDATVMHALGARHALLVKVLLWEYALIALVTTLVAVGFGSLLATLLLQWRLDLSASGLYWTGGVTAVGVSVVSLGFGVVYLMSQMRLRPALLLRTQ